MSMIVASMVLALLPVLEGTDLSRSNEFPPQPWFTSLPPSADAIGNPSQEAQDLFPAAQYEANTLNRGLWVEDAEGDPLGTCTQDENGFQGGWYIYNPKNDYMTITAGWAEDDDCCARVANLKMKEGASPTNLIEAKVWYWAWDPSEGAHDMVSFANMVFNLGAGESLNETDPEFKVFFAIGCQDYVDIRFYWVNIPDPATYLGRVRFGCDESVCP